MNYTHAVTGLVGSVAALPIVSATTPVAPHGAAVLPWVALWAGAATLPDMDHPSSSPARFVPPVGVIPSASRVLARWLAAASGGHRHALHWLTSGVLAGGLAGVACLAPSPLWLVLPMIYICALGLWIIRFGNRTESVLAGSALVALAFFHQHGHPWWVGVAIAGGYMTHIIGDRFFGGCYAAPGTFVQYAELDTDGIVEHGIVRPLAWVSFIVLAAVSLYGWADSARLVALALHAIHN
jgi:hypothetical protein